MSSIKALSCINYMFCYEGLEVFPSGSSQQYSLSDLNAKAVELSLCAAPFNLIVSWKTLITICAIINKQGQLLFVAWATEVWKERVQYLNTVPHTFLDTLCQFSFSLNTHQNECTQSNFLVKFPVKVYNALNFPGYVDPCNTSNDQKSWEARYGFFQPIR